MTIHIDLINELTKENEELTKQLNIANDTIFNASVREELFAKDSKACHEWIKEMREALKEAKRMYESVQPSGGWQGVYEQIIEAIGK